MPVTIAITSPEPRTVAVGVQSQAVTVSQDNPGSNVVTQVFMPVSRRVETVSPAPRSVVVQPAPPRAVAVTPAPQRAVTVASVGVQGPPGPQGPIGPSFDGDLDLIDFTLVFDNNLI